MPVVTSYAVTGAHDCEGEHWFGGGFRPGGDVQAKVRDGWAQGRDRMETLRDSLTQVKLLPRDRKRKLIRSDFGDTLDIHQVYAGRLDIAWRRPRRQQSLGPQKIALYANMLCSGYEHSDVLFYRGAAAAMLADLLQNAGYMVRLTVGFGGKVADTGEKSSCRITVKDYGMPLDITSTSATILPGFFRALGHAWVAAHAKKLGNPSLYVQQGIVEPDEILLSHNVKDHGTAVAFLNDTLEKLNSNTLQAA